jgi:hypothetical protein
MINQSRTMRSDADFYTSDIEVLAANLEAVRLGGKKRLIINVPPRTLKSFLGSIVFPAFALGHNPSLNILCTSYAQQDGVLAMRWMFQCNFRCSTT